MTIAERIYRRFGSSNTRVKDDSGRTIDQAVRDHNPKWIRDGSLEWAEFSDTSAIVFFDFGGWAVCGPLQADD